MTRSLNTSVARRSVLILVAAGLAACSKSSDSTGPSTTSGSIALSLQPSVGSLTQGVGGIVNVTIARTTFTGAVALTVTGLPAGVTGVFNPASTTGTTSVLTLTASTTATLGTVQVTVRGTGSGIADATAQLTLQVIAAAGGGSGTTTLSFALCGANQTPIWLAFQDGDGAWVRVTPTGVVYSFTITQSRGGYAYVLANSANAGRTITVFYGTRTELSSGGATTNMCTAANPNVKTISGSFANVPANMLAYVQMGGSASGSSGSLPFSLPNVKDGVHDLIAFRSAFTGASTNDRGLIRQDQNYPNGTNVGVLDMTGAESFAAATATLTLGGLSAGESVSQASFVLLSGAACDLGLLAAWQPGTSPFLVSGIPDNKLRATDMHQFMGITNAIVGTSTSSRFITEVFHSISTRTVALGATIAPVTTVAAGNYKRLNTAFSVPAEYNAAVALTYNATTGTPRSVSITASTGWVGGSTAGLVMPTFTGLPGWDDTWGPGASAAVSYGVTAIGTNLTAGTSQCTAGLRNLNVTFSGTI